MGSYLREINTPPPGITDRFKRLYTREDIEASEDSRTRLIFATISLMGSLAFCAGKTPKDIVIEHKLKVLPNQIGTRELMVDGTTFHHINRTEIKASTGRVLKINLRRASNVKHMDHTLLDHHSDPYVVFSVGKSMSKSFVALNSPNPVWNTKHYLFIKKKPILTSGDDKLQVDLFDCDKFMHRETLSLSDMIHWDDVIARTTIDLHQLQDTGLHSKRIVYPRSGGLWMGQMSLEFSYQFLTVDQFLNDIGKTDDSYWLDNFHIHNATYNWEELYGKMEKGAVPMTPFAYLDAQTTSTEAWIYTNHERKVVVASFKGTDLSEHRDILTDATAHAEPVQSIFADDCVLKPKRTFSPQDGYVHHGFLHAYNSVHENLLETLYAVTNWQEDWLVVLTGHSLGGALASLCAFEVANRQLNGKAPQVGMFNFGSPRFAHGNFSARYAESVPASFRFRHYHDVVPIYPAHLWHIGNLVLGRNDSSVDIVYPQSLAWLLSHHSAEDMRDCGTWLHVIPWHDHVKYHSQTAYFQKVSNAMRKIFPGAFRRTQAQVHGVKSNVKGLKLSNESGGVTAARGSRMDRVCRIGWTILICALLFFSLPRIFPRLFLTRPLDSTPK